MNKSNLKSFLRRNIHDYTDSQGKYSQSKSEGIRQQRKVQLAAITVRKEDYRTELQKVFSDCIILR